ncbi:hypothetical protein [Acinetobacter sp. WCHAc010034]|uniref:hypothetical protein n=1 Tax=Acinetobacter sp. WCHAc010034 TaxID=1879049 RepID=UPI0013C2E306|nr:hypothetical protein [Acinetobacter sp. WCHAc010034]
MIVEVNDSVFSYTALRIQRFKSSGRIKNLSAAAKTSRYKSALKISNPALQPQALHFSTASSFHL